MTRMPFRSPKKLSTSTGLRPSSSLTLSGVRPGARTAAAMFAGWAAAGAAVTARANAANSIPIGRIIPSVRVPIAAFIARGSDRGRRRGEALHVPFLALKIGSPVLGGGSSMATVTSDRRELLSAERRFYSRMALFMAALMFVAFAPSFYLRDVVPSYPRPNPTLPPSVILHGIIFTLWMLVFIAQTQLVANRRVDLHMKLGKASMLLALVIIPFMYLVGV